MFDFSWSEILVVGAVALVVIGPKDLPKALKTAGMVVRRARGLAREFQNSIDDMIRESELDDIRRSVQQVTSGNLNDTIHKAIDPDGHLSKPLFTPSDTPMQPLETKVHELPPSEPHASPTETTPAEPTPTPVSEKASPTP